MFHIFEMLQLPIKTQADPKPQVQYIEIVRLPKIFPAFYRQEHNRDTERI